MVKKLRTFKLPVIGAVVVAVAVSMFVVHRFPTTVKAQSQQPKNCLSCSQEDTRVIYAPTIDMPGTSSSDIVLNCRSVHEMHAIPTFYTTDGQAVVGNEIVLQPSEMRFVPVKSLIPTGRRNQNWGGMSLSYYGKLRELWAQITTHGKGQHGSSDILFNVIDGKGASIQDAVWFMPAHGKSVIALGNSSSSPIHVTAEFSDDVVESDVPAFGTGYIRRNSNGSNSDSVHLTTNGPAGSLKVVGYVTENDSSYASMIRFYETPTVVQPNLYATDFKVRNATTKMFLRNTSQSAVIATIKFYPLEGSGQPFEMAPVVLNGSEIEEINLSSLHSALENRPDLGNVTVRVMNSGPNGSLIGALYSVNNTNGLVGDVPLRDSGQYSNSTGAYPWRLDNDYKTKVVLNNTGDEATDFTGAITFNGGEYYLKKQEIKAGESIVFDIQKIRDEQIKDFKGNVIPLNASIGQFRWGLASAKPGVSHLVGRSEVTSPSGHVSISYSCAQDCGFSGPFIDEWPTDYWSVVGEITPFSVVPYYYDGYGYRYDQDLDVISTFGTGNSSVATVAESFDAADLEFSGVNSGTTTWSAGYWYNTWDYDPDRGCIPTYTFIDTGGDVTVTPTVTITDFQVVGKGSTVSVPITVVNPHSKSITLNIRTASGTGSAKFADTNTTTKTITSSVTAQVTGVTESSAKDNFVLEAKVGSTTLPGSHTFTVAKIKISQTPSGGSPSEITGTVSTIVGQKLHLSAEIVPSGLTASALSWTLPTTVVKDFVTTASTGNSEAVTGLTTNAVDFLWVDGSISGTSKSVTHAATINGNSVSGTANFTVYAPTTSLTSVSGTTNVGLNPNDSNRIWLGLFPASGHTGGIEFTSSKTEPTGFSSGSLQFVQLVNHVNVSGSFTDSSPITITLGSGLDGCYPYASGTTTRDSPDVALERSPLNAQTETYDGSWTMYAMYKPAGADTDWVPVNAMNWLWKGKGDLTSSSPLTYTPTAITDPGSPSGSSTTTYPAWTQVILAGC